MAVAEDIGFIRRSRTFLNSASYGYQFVKKKKKSIWLLFVLHSFRQKYDSVVSWGLRWLKNLPSMQETRVQALDPEDPLEKGMATHSSILAWRILGQRSLAGYSQWGCKESDTAEQLTLRIQCAVGLGRPGWKKIP